MVPLNFLGFTRKFHGEFDCLSLFGCLVGELTGQFRQQVICKIRLLYTTLPNMEDNSVGMEKLNL